MPPPSRPSTVRLSQEGGVSGRPLRLEVVSGPDAGRVVLLTRLPFRVGTLDENDLVLSDPAVSRRHFQITLDGDRHRIEDLDSTNGTFVGKARVREAYLEPGSLVTAGKSVVRFAPSFEKGGVPPSPKTRFGGLVGGSLEMRTVFGILERVAPTDATVLLTGETGTGKELAARAVHAASARRAGPFVVFDSGAVTPTLIESELFGHRKGAFTGAAADRSGLFEEAHGGTLFLDEIGELPIDLQPKLLRAIESREVRRVGDNVSRRVDVRLVAATHRDLREAVGEGRFREDLYWRLSVVEVRLPPLRERREDIPLLVEAILQEEKAPPPTREALEILAAYHWPGNVRELRNVLLRAVALSASRALDPALLASFAAPPEGKKAPEIPSGTLEELERLAIDQALAAAKGNKTRAAKALGISPSTLYEKIKKYGLT